MVKKIALWFYLIMACVVSCFPIRWAVYAGDTYGYFYSISYMLGIILMAISSFHLLRDIRPKSAIMVFLLKIFSLMFLFLPCILYLAYFVPYVTIEKPLTSADIIALSKTYPQESYIYFFQNVKWKTFGWVSLILVTFIGSLIYYAKTYQKRIRVKWLESFLLITGGILFALFIHNPVTAPIEDAFLKLYDYRLFADRVRKSAGISKQKDESKSKGIYVIVIGESQNRKHMSVYGYHRPTTPFLSAQSNNHSKGEWIFLNNPYACYTHTLEVLTWALTDLSSFNRRKLSESKTLIEVLHAHGYQTWWISNHKKHGVQSEIASLSQHQFWLNQHGQRDPYDEIVLEQLPQETELLQAKSAVVFIHLLGNHIGYRDRYPASWNRFGNTKTDTYDNSILYNDYIISQIYNHFSSMKNFAAMIYMADHADDVDSGFCSHNASLFTWDMVKIPFFAFFSKNYIQNNYEKVRNLKSNINTPFVNEFLFDTALGIMGIEDTHYCPENDFSSASYSHSVNDLSTLQGRKKLSEEKNDAVLKHRFKIYLDRVNSPKKFKELRNRYIGFEMDVIYHEKENAFENSHEATDLTNYPLEETMAYYRGWQELWFNFKNLTNENSEKIFKCYNDLLRKKHIPKSRIWLEGSDVEALEIFTKNGWNTSYHLPNFDLDQMAQKQKEQIKTMIEKISASGKIKAISFDSKYYTFMSSLNLAPEISFLIRFPEKTFNELRNQADFTSIINDPKVKSVLVSEHGKWHR